MWGVMSALAVLLVFKIGVTLIAVAGPFLFASQAFIDRIFGVEAGPGPVYRLYGMAMLALVVAYTGGLIQVLDGNLPVGILIMGIVSNLGAAAVLFITGFVRKTPMLTAFFASVGVGLVAALFWPDAAMQFLWGV